MLEPINGVDVGSLQGNINWPKVKTTTNIRFGIVRTTRGLEEVDTAAQSNYAGMYQNGILPGTYHRAFVDMGKPEQQALHYAMHWNRVTFGSDIMLPPALDYEDQKPGKEFCQRFIEAFRGYTGVEEMLIYTSGSFVDTWLGGEAWMDEKINLWIADYGGFTGATPGNPKYKTEKVYIHQYSSKLKLAANGIPGNSAGDTDGDITTKNLHEIVIRR
jgi:GH25 family lysozyme M1 (1,4-beta-N-acetylmuramidase)